MKKYIARLLLTLLLVVSLSGCGLWGTTIPDDFSGGQLSDSGDDLQDTTQLLDPAGSYSTKENVALYLWLYGELPGNFMTKQEARALGWNGGSLEPYAPGYSIGGDRFGNYEGLLPEEDSYWECDIDTLGANGRGAKRIVFSRDGDIYYTGDHYETFTVITFTEDYVLEEVPLE